MERGRYILYNTAVLGVIILAAVMIYVGVGAVNSTKALAIAIILCAVGLLVVGTLADAARRAAHQAPPRGWVKCSSEWVEKHGRAACVTSPKIVNRIGGQHYHPAA